jgi:hypothetical protein
MSFSPSTDAADPSLPLDPPQSKSESQSDSIDQAPANVPGRQPVGTEATEIGDWQSPPWAELAAGLARRFAARPLSRLFADWQPVVAKDQGGCLRSGLAIAQAASLTPLQIALGDLASGQVPGPKRIDAIDWPDAAEEMLRRIDEARSPGKIDPVVVTDALLWAYALPPLIDRISETNWKALCQSLDALARHCIAVPDASSVGRLIGGCELSLVLRLRLGELASDSLAQQAVEGLCEWCDAAEDSIATAVRGGGRYARLVIASILRQRRLAESVAKCKLKRRRLGTAIDLACWVAAMTRRDGTAAFARLSRDEIRDDVARGGFFEALKTLSPKLLVPAIDATLGRTPSGGRLAWAVSLPESLWHSELAGAAVMLPEWDVRRGRTYVDYAGEDFRIEIEYGRDTAIRGNWEVMIQVDGADQAAAGPWTHICEYSDDDAQYLEFEQRWTGGVRLQRQIMLLRDDRCVMMGDAVLRDADLPPAIIGYLGRVPLATDVTADMEPETHEVWMRDPGGKPRALALSLQTNEWRTGPSAARYQITEDHNLRLQTTSQPPRDNGGSLFVPLWLDFQQRRFGRPRTYRQLTVGDELRIVDPDEAVAHRIQMGSEHWVTYRSLRGERTRTFMGKHLVADFYCARFHPGDGSIEDLLTVGDHDEDIQRAASEAAGKGGGVTAD